MSDPFEGIDDEVADLAVEALRLVGDWAFRGNVRVPPEGGGGELDGMSLDEALARADAVNDSLASKIEKRQLAEKVAKQALDIALGVLVRSLP